MTFKALIHLARICCCLLLLACSPSDGATPNRQHGKTVSAYVDVINYNHDRTYQYTLYDIQPQALRTIGGEIVWVLSSGGNTNCCVSLPQKWQPGLKLRMEWGEADETIKKEIGRYQRDLNIPRYSQPGNLYVVFGPAAQPELVVSPVEPGHPDWPGSIKQTPWNYCVAKNGRKACKAAMPKLFSATENQGYCTDVFKRNVSKAKDYCAVSMIQCMHDYEDKEFCKKTLWQVAPVSMAQCMQEYKDNEFCKRVLWVEGAEK